MLRYASESNLKRTALELGGKTPQVVFADANLEAAAYDIAWGIYYNSGETCHAGSRLIVHESVRAELLEGIARVTATITQGHPLDPTTQMGAVIDRGHMDRVLGFIDSGVASGARIVLGGHRAMEDSGGFYVEADHPRRRAPGDEGGARGDLRAGTLGDDFQDEAYGGADGQRHPLRAGGGRVDC